MKKPTTPVKHQQSIAIVVPNTIEKKMDAIVSLSHAVLKLSKALNSTHIVATVANCHFENCKTTAIEIGVK